MQANNPIVTRIYAAAMQLFAEQGRPQVNVSELAQAAGLSRGSVYNHISAPETLFETIAARLGEEMHGRVVASFNQDMDPAHRLANGIRYFTRRAHEEPHWGRFISRFALSNESLQGMWREPVSDVLNGLEQELYKFRSDQLPSAIALIAGSTLSAMFLVLEGHRAWRDAGSDAAELVLRSLGVPAEAARRYATVELPPLADSPAAGPAASH